MLNEIGAAIFESHKPLFVDAYGRNRATGGFILIDPLSNETAGAGMITGRQFDAFSATRGDQAAKTGPVTAAERAARSGHRAAVVWLPAPLDLAYALEREFFEQGYQVVVVDVAARNSGFEAVIQSLLAAGMIVLCAVPDDDQALCRRLQKLLDPRGWIVVDIALKKEPADIRQIFDQLKGRIAQSPT
jgi:hypothetical protein